MSACEDRTGTPIFYEVYRDLRAFEKDTFGSLHGYVAGYTAGGAE